MSPITWDDSYFLLRELEKAVEQIDKLSEQLEPIFSDDSFWNDPQNKDLVKNIEEADKCFIEFSSHFSRIDSVLEEEGPKEWYDKDYEYLSAQLKKAAEASLSPMTKPVNCLPQLKKHSNTRSWSQLKKSTTHAPRIQVQMHSPPVQSKHLLPIESMHASTKSRNETC